MTVKLTCLETTEVKSDNPLVPQRNHLSQIRLKLLFGYTVQSTHTEDVVDQFYNPCSTDWQGCIAKALDIIIIDIKFNNMTIYHLCVALNLILDYSH